MVSCKACSLSAWMQSIDWFYMESGIFRALLSITSLRTECFWDSHWLILVNSESMDCSSCPWLAHGCCSWKAMCWPEARWCLWSQGFQHSWLYCLVAHFGEWFYFRVSHFHLKNRIYKAIKEIIFLLNVKTFSFFISSNNRLFALILLLIFLRGWWWIYRNVIGRILLFSFCLFFLLFIF